MSPTLRSISLLLAVALSSTPLLAQDGLTVRTFTLRAMRADDAARLVSPYVQSEKGAVFEVSGRQQAITVRETPTVLARVDSVLRVFDRVPATLILRFDLIAALDSAHRDPAIDGVDAALRGLFRFPGYRLLAQGSTTTAERGVFALTLGNGSEQYVIDGEVGAIDATDAGRRLHLDVRLNRALVDRPGPQQRVTSTLLSTGLALPLGQTVVLGSAAPGGSTLALILVVRPELAPERR